MFKISKIEKATFYIDNAMNAMEEFAIKERENIEERFKKNPSIKNKGYDVVKLDKRKDLELEKIRFLNKKLDNTIKKIISRFPKFKNVEEVYIKLINTSQTPVKDLEDALSRLNWITHKIDEFTQNTEHKLKKAKTQQTIGFLMKKYLGKVNSLFRKNKDIFETLDEARKFMNKLPKFENIYTVAIGGFPNVGKSTLMQKLTNSNVEIQNYPFTTKGLMFGYINQGNTKSIQLIDTPGLLGREKQNPIEKRAQLILSEHSDVIVFVLDLTQTCGYSIKNQVKLLKQTRDLQKPMAIYLSKTDIFDEDAGETHKEYESILKKYKVFDDAKKLKEYLIEQKSNNKKFDIKNIKVIK